MNDDGIRVQLGFSEPYRRVAAEILCAAFERKLAPLLGRRHIVPVLEGDLNARAFLAAFVGGRLVGLAGVEWRGQRYLCYTRATLVRELGPLRGALQYGLLRLVAHAEPPSGELSLVAVAVHPDWRGRGAGTRLLRAAEELARARGLRAMRLDVVDTNPGARRLYERLGFRPVKEHWVPILRPIAGFGVYTTMVKTLSDGE